MLEVVTPVGGKSIEGVEVKEGAGVAVHGRPTTSWVSWPSAAASPPPDTDRNVEAPIKKL